MWWECHSHTSWRDWGDDSPLSRSSVCSESVLCNGNVIHKQAEETGEMIPSWSIPVCVLSQFYVTGKHGNVIHIQAEETGEMAPPEPLQCVYWASSMWWESVGMSFTYKLKRLGRWLPCATPVCVLSQFYVTGMSFTCKLKRLGRWLPCATPVCVLR